MRELIDILIERIQFGDITQNEIIEELEILKEDASHLEYIEEE